jgi:hypothetical protein
VVDEINLVLGAFLIFTPWIFGFWNTGLGNESILGPLDAWGCGAAIGLTALIACLQDSPSVSIVGSLSPWSLRAFGLKLCIKNCAALDPDSRR